MEAKQSNLSQGLSATGSEVAENLRYWTAQLSGETYHRFNIRQQGAPANSLARKLDAALAERLWQMSSQQEGSLRLMLLCCYALALSRYTGRQRIVIGVGAWGAEEQPACLPLPIHINPADTFKALLLATKERYQQALAHAAFPMKALLGKLDLENEHQLYTACFGIPVADEPMPLLLHADIDRQTVQISLRTAQQLNIVPAHFLDHFVQLLSQIAGSPYAPLGTYSLVSTAEQEILLDWGRGEQNDFAGRHMLDLWDGHVTATPAAQALSGPDGNMSYRELDAWAGELSATLKNNFAITAGAVVAVLCRRGKWQTGAMLAALKCGAAFLTIDPSLPAERVRYMLDDAGAALLLTDTAFDWENGRQWLTSETPADMYAAGNYAPSARDPQHTAYMIYTSGTTGRPKATAIAHNAFVNMVLDQQSHMDINADDRVLQFASASFDAAVFETFLALLSGACLVQVTPEIIRVPADFEAFVIRESISFMLLPPVYLSQLDKDRISAVKTIAVGGDYPPAADLQALIAKGVRCYNLYGPSETAVIAAAYRVLANDRTPLPVGRPLSNTCFYVLDEQRQLLPQGVRGELYIGGVSVAQGYHLQPGLTAEKFVSSPYGAGKLYRTGDWASWREDGQLVLEGRTDDQVKVRGYRVEPLEIQQHIAAIEHIKEAVVITDTLDGSIELRGFFTASRSFAEGELQQLLQQQLPAYMVPASLMQVLQLPLNYAGKPDKKALLDKWRQQQASVRQADYIPATPAEAAIQEVWRQVLDRRLGPDQHFFNEGGDSIKAIQASSRLTAMGYVLTVRDIFTYPTLAQLAGVIRRQPQAEAAAMVSGRIPLSPIQRSFLEKEQPEPWHFNQAVVIRLHTALSPARLDAAFTALLAHHDALRSIFTKQEETYVQECLPAPLPLTVITHDYRGRPDAPALIQRTATAVQATLSLEKAPLLRIDHYQLGEQDYLGISVHHLVMDAVSWGILLEDLDRLLQDETAQLPVKTASWKSWCESLAAYEPRALPTEMKGLSRLPADKESAAENIAGRTATVSFMLGETLSRQLDQEVHGAYGTNAQDLLVAALAQSVFQLWDTTQVSIDIETHGRQLQDGMDVSRTIGWFTGIYPFTLQSADVPGPEELIIHTKTTLRRMQARCLDYMCALPFMPQEERPGILFNYLGTVAGSSYRHFDWSPIIPAGTQSPLTKREYDWEVNAIITGGKLLVSFTYSSDRFEAATMARLSDAMQAQLRTLVAAMAGQTAQLEDIYPLTPMQEGMRYHALVDGEAGYYTTQLAYELAGTLDTALLAQAYQLLIKRHTGLRSNFIQDKSGRAWQVVRKEVHPVFEVTDLSSLDEATAGQHIRGIKEQELAKGFDLGTDLLMRVSIFCLRDQRYYFLWSYHHIIMDGWSMSILVAEWMALYQQLLRGQSVSLPPAKPYRHYIEWLYNNDREASYRYWQHYLAGYSGRDPLPHTGIAAARIDTAARVNRSLLLDEEQSQRIRQLVIQFDVTLNVLVQGVWSLILSRYTGAADVVFGIVVSGRPAAMEGMESMVGLFINNIPVRANLQDDPLFSALLQQLQQHQVQSEPHQYCSLADIQSRVRGAGALVDHILLFENFPLAENLERSLTGSAISHDFSITSAEAVDINNYPFTLVVMPGQQIQVRVNFNPQVHPAGVVDDILQYLQVIFDRLLAAGDQPVRQLGRYPEALEQALLRHGYEAAYPVTGPATFIAQFERAVQRFAHRPALQDNEGALSYQQLDEKANRLAHLLLQSCNVQAGDVVAVHMERSAAAFVAICGILKAGAVYVPVDPGWPASRKSYIFDDAGVKVVLALFDHFAGLSELGRKVIAIDIQLDNESLAITPPDVHTAPGDRAYIIYTSGSTGQPKGVQIQHQANVNMALDQVRQFGISEEDRVLQFAPLFFDASVYEWSIAFYAGACLLVPDERTIRSQALFNAYLQAQQVSMATLPPPFFNLLPADTTSWPRVVVQAGSAPDVAATLAVSRYAQCYNAYGPTECAVCIAVHPVTEEDAILATLPVGRPVGGNTILLLDEHMEMAPMGAVGEICVSGINLSMGYTGDDPGRQAAFITHPLLPGQRVYRTGDLGRMLPGHQLLYTGRKDRQLKIRGYRIEPLEVEGALRQQKGVVQAAVGAEKDHSGMSLLVAYVVTAERCTEKQLKQQLQETLPAYMIPDRIVEVTEIPLTPNGKVDFEALRKKRMNESGSATPDLPSNKIEQELHRMWSATLEHESFGIHDKYFEVGGNSLSLIRLHAQLKERYPGILVADLFNYNTIAEMAVHIAAVAGVPEKLIAAGIPCTAGMPDTLQTGTAFRSADISAASWASIKSSFSDALPGLSDEDIVLAFFFFMLYESTGATVLKLVILDKTAKELKRLAQVNMDNIDSREALMAEVAAQRRQTSPSGPLYQFRFEKAANEITVAFCFGGVQETTAPGASGIDLLLRAQVARNGDLRMSLAWQEETVSGTFAAALLQGMGNIIDNLTKTYHD